MHDKLKESRRLFKAETWEEIKMLAEDNEYLQEQLEIKEQALKEKDEYIAYLEAQLAKK